MKKSHIILLLISAYTITIQAAPNTYTSSDRWYIASTAGLSIPSDSDVNSTNGTTLDNDPDYNISFAGGYDWDGKRAELEYSHRRSDRLMFNSLMINVLYDYPLSDQIYWFNGFGLGVSFVNFETQNSDDTDAQLAWQLITGLGYKLTRDISITGTYRLFASRDARFAANGVNYEIETPYLSSFEIGIKYSF